MDTRIKSNLAKEERPWGFFEVLFESSQFKIKKIAVYPLKRTSLQRHKYRDEHWFFLNGEGIVTIENEKGKKITKKIKRGSSINIEKIEWHRLENVSNKDLLELIEIQTGTYFGEDDIERKEDDYGRVKA